MASLRHTTEALAPTGRLYLSTLNTPGLPQCGLQYHVHEWSHVELIGMLDEVGILPPPPDTVEAEVACRFGPQAVEFYRHMREFAPNALLGPVVATALGEAAIETFYVCSRNRHDHRRRADHQHRCPSRRSSRPATHDCSR